MTSTGNSSQASISAETICGAFAKTVEANRDDIALRTGNGATEWSWGEYSSRVESAAGGLAGIGIGPGTTVACWMVNRPEFHVADTAAIGLGAAAFSVYNTYTPEQAAHVIGDAGSRVLVTEPEYLEKALAVLESGDTALETIVLATGEDDRAMSWRALCDGAPEGFDFEQAMGAAGPDDLATLIYTSGTTGAPKGVQLTHRNVMSQVRALNDHLSFKRGIRAISWLPMAHVAERISTLYFPSALGWEVTTCADPRNVAAEIVSVHPNFFFSPPRLWEKLRAAILLQADPPVRAELDAAAERVRAGDGVQDGPVQEALRQKLGFGELGTAIVGAAPCAPEVIEFWHAAGVPLSELYGMSETSGVATVNPPDAIRIGTVGTPVSQCEVRLSEEGEVLMRGPVVMSGYRNLPEKTRDVFDDEGWLHSGDVGEIDDDGYLRIVDRIKELIINSAGKNMSPANIEATLKMSSDLISQACVIGDSRPYNVALITLDPANPAASSPGTEVSTAVERANSKLARVEQIKRFAVLDEEWNPGGDELTPTMKLKRKPIAEKFAAEIEEMYADEAR